MRRWIGLGAVSGLALVAAAAGARQPNQPAAAGDNQALAALLQCRALTDSAARLACYDKAAGAIADATASKSLVVLDREQVRKTRRSLFGFELPSLNLFGKDTPEEAAEASQITAKAQSALENREGRWLVTLDDGAQWLQTDDHTIALPPHSGSTIVLKRAALGSYFMRIDNQPGVKAQRVK